MIPAFARHLFRSTLLVLFLTSSVACAGAGSHGGLEDSGAIEDSGAVEDGAVVEDGAAAASRATTLIRELGMQPIPHEGGWFVRTHVSDEHLAGGTLPRYPQDRSLYSAIHTLVTTENFSALHRLRTDEFWLFYEGAPLELLLLYPNGSGERKILGADVLAGQARQVLVPRGVWMGARPLGPEGGYSFFGNVLAPGFDYADYQPGDRQALLTQYPDFSAAIMALTRTPKADAAVIETTRALAPPPVQIEVQIEALIGRDPAATAPSETLGIARFTLAANTALPKSRMRTSTEAYIVTSGTGTVLVNDVATAVAAGSVVHIPPRAPHSIAAHTALTFYAVTAPAFIERDFERLDTEHLDTQ